MRRGRESVKDWEEMEKTVDGVLKGLGEGVDMGDRAEREDKEKRERKVERGGKRRRREEEERKMWSLLEAET